MNKFTKGAIATGAGVVLLLGGAGTFALWNDSETVGTGTISSGTLSIAQDTGAGVWTNGANTITTSTFKIVPGDVLVYSNNVKVNATGDNLHALLSVDTTAFANGTLAKALTYQVQATADGTTVVDNANGTFTINPGTTGVTDLAVTVKVTFPSSVTGTDHQGESVALNNLKLVLQQQ